MSYTVWKDTGQLDDELFFNETADLIMHDEALLKEEHEILERYHPIYNYWHLLQSRPSEKDVADILKHAPSITIMTEGEDGCELNHYITLNSCGMDYTDSIAFAYMVIDQIIPKGLLFNLERTTISKKGWARLEAFLSKTKDDEGWARAEALLKKV